MIKDHFVKKEKSNMQYKKKSIQILVKSVLLFSDFIKIIILES